MKRQILLGSWEYWWRHPDISFSILNGKLKTTSRYCPLKDKETDTAEKLGIWVEAASYLLYLLLLLITVRSYFNPIFHYYVL
jgi:hypothetical protein